MQRNFWFVVMLSLLMGLAYVMLRPQASTLLVDVLGFNRQYLTSIEPGVFVAYMIAIGLLLYRWRFYIEPRKYKIHIADAISNLEQYEPALDTLYDAYKSYISRAHSSAGFDISARPDTTVFAITGHWRAGKTTAAGQFVQKLREDKSTVVLGEYYHDSFNFGNVSESIASFFGQLAEMTGVVEFEDLGKASTPAIDSSVEIGPLTFNNPFHDLFSQEATGVLRKKAHDKLRHREGAYIVVIDDLDRLQIEEQLLWLRVIELLGRFAGKIVLLVPVNISILEQMIEQKLVSKQYIDKILPVQLHVGVDLSYIRRRMLRNNLGFKRQELFSKYVLSLALRVAISEHQSRQGTASSWRVRLSSGEVSPILTQYVRNLGFGSVSGTWGEEYYRGEFEITRDIKGIAAPLTLDTNNEIRILMSNNEQYQNFFGGRMAFRSFGYGPNELGGGHDYSQESASTLRSYSELYQLFDDVRYKYGEIKREATYDNLLDEDVVREGSYWFDLVYPTLQQVDSDPAFSRYFSYRLIDQEIDTLLTKKEKDIPAYLAQLVYDNKTAH